MSRPAQNARSPAARSTTALVASSSLTIRHAASISSHMVRLNAFSTSGRFRVMVATRSVRSNSQQNGLERLRRGRSFHHQRHFQFGARFSMKASGPSSASSVRTTRSRKVSARISAS